MQHGYEKIVKNVMDLKTHHKNKHATAYCCWQGGGAELEAKLSLWAEFQPFSW